jgi:hypothetical protein
MIKEYKVIANQVEPDRTILSHVADISSGDSFVVNHGSLWIDGNLYREVREVFFISAVDGSKGMIVHNPSAFLLPKNTILQRCFLKSNEHGVNIEYVD